MSASPDSDDDSDWEDVPVKHLSVTSSLGLASQPLDVTEALAMQLASWSRGHEGTRALVALLSTCHALNNAVKSSARVWDTLSRKHYAFYPPQRLDLRVAFPFISPGSASSSPQRHSSGAGAPLSSLEETEALVQARYQPAAEHEKTDD